MAGVLLFGRRVKVILAAPIKDDFKTVDIQTLEITDLRVAFKVVKTLGTNPNTAEVSVYNLSSATRGQLPSKGAKFIIQAGYDQTLVQLFIGDARLLESRRDGVEWVTKIQSGDGERAFAHARVNESFAAGVPVYDVVQKIGKAVGLDVGNLTGVAIPSSTQFVNGYAAQGRALPELEKVLAAQGYTLSVQDGKLQALKPGDTLTEPVVELSPDTGLVGSPEMGSGQKKGSKPVLKAKSLLQGAITPGGKVKIVSAQYNGLFKALKVEHSGDTAGGEWYTSLELEAV